MIIIFFVVSPSVDKNDYKMVSLGITYKYSGEVHYIIIDSSTHIHLVTYKALYLMFRQQYKSQTMA